MGHEFRDLLNQLGIKSKPTTVKNPQGNSICERMHKTVADVLRTLVKDKPPKDHEEAVEYMDNGTCRYVTSSSTTVGYGEKLNSNNGRKATCFIIQEEGKVYLTYYLAKLSIHSVFLCLRLYEGFWSLHNT